MLEVLHPFRGLRSAALAAAVLGLASVSHASEHHGRVFFNSLPVPGVTVTLILGGKSVTTVTDLQGLYSFADLADGTWTASLQMPGFQTVTGPAVVSSSAPAASWTLQMLSLQNLLASTHAAAPVILQPRPIPVKTVAARPDSAAAEAPPPSPPPPSEASADGLLINGSDNNAATSKYSLAPAFGNRRPGSRALYNGSLGVIASNAAFDARPYSLTGLDIPKASYNRITFVATLGGPLNIPHLLPHGPNFFIAYQRTRDQNASTLSGLVPTAAERSGDVSALLNGTILYDPITGLPLTGPLAVSAQAQALLRLYPLPNLAGSTNYNYQTQVLNDNHADALQSRLDKGIGRRDQIYGAFGLRSSRADTTSLFGFRDTTGTLGLDGDIHWSHRFPHGILTDAGYQFSRLRTQVRPNFQGSQNISGQAGITGNDQDSADWGPPDLVFSSGISALTDGISAFNRNRTDAFTATATWVHRKHTTIFGGDIRRQEFNQYTQQNPRGVFTFTGAATAGSVGAGAGGTGSDFADFLLGVPDTSKLAFGNPDKYFRQTVYDGFVTDDWRIRPEFTLNAGLRWDYGAPLTELKDRLVNLDVTEGFAAVAPVLASSPTGSLTGTRYPSSLIQPDKRDFEPRVGLAWRPFPTSTMVVRAGYGIYVDTSVYLGSTQLLAQQAPLSKSVSVSNSPACPLTLANGFRDCAGTTSSTFAIDPNFRVGYAQIWRLSVQRDLPAALVLTGSYLGTKGTRGPQEFLPQTYPIGAADPCPQCARGYIYRVSDGNSSRHAAELQLRRRLRSGLTATVDYLYAKATDDDSDLGGQGHLTTVADSAGTSGTPGTIPVLAQNWLDLRGERSRSSFDQRHLLKFTFQYTSGQGLGGGTLLGGWRGTLLKQWTVASQFSAGTGLPETPVYLAAVPGTGVTGTIRPNRTSAPIYQGPSGYFLNAAAYAAPTPGAWGSAGRNSITGPNQVSLDSSLARTFKLREPFSFDLRLDATNLLNHVVFTAWNPVVNSTTFGLPSSTQQQRSLQLTGRVRF